MQGFIKSVAIICALLFSNIVHASTNPVLSLYDFNNVIPQQDSVRTRMLVDALNTYKEALKDKPSDSLEIFKNLGLISAELKQPEEALYYTAYYINYSADTSILENDSYNKIINTKEYTTLKNRYLVNVNIFAFIYFIIAIIGFFFAVLINFKKDSDRITNLLIGGFVAVHVLFILEFGIYASNLRYVYPHTYLMSSSIALFYGPLLYFYFKRITQKYKFSIKDMLHLVPIVALLIMLFPFYLLSAEEKLKVIFNISSVYSREFLFYLVFIPKLSSYVVYGIFIGILYFDTNKKLTITWDNVFIKWKRNIYYFHIMYMFSYLLYGLSAGGILLEYSNFIYHSQIIAMAVMVFYIAQMAYLHPKVFDFESYLLNGTGLSKYLKSGLTESLSKELKEELITLLRTEKVYRDNSISLETLSEKLNTTRHNTSQIINEHFDMNFFELINKFRIEEAINLLLEDTNGNLNIIDIAYEVGYNNKVTFNKAFKKETSLTPTQFMEAVKSGQMVNR